MDLYWISVYFSYNYSMNEDFIEQIEPTPLLHSKKCKIAAFLLRIFLQFGTFFIAFIMWLLYDYFVAIAAFLLMFIVIGIIRSKLRNSVIPLSQREYQYSDQGIADWYMAKEFCFGIDK